MRHLSPRFTPFPLRAALVALTLILTGCATNSVSLLNGEADQTAGSIAVLDPGNETEISVIDKVGSIANVSGSNVSVKTMDAATMEAANAALFASLPKVARTFTLYFKEGSTDPTPESAALLDEIFAEIKRRPGADLQIIGHTDSVGSEEDNDGLSLRRAAEITAYLFTLGLDKTIVRLGGRGERELKEQTGDNVASAMNRRVEVWVR